MGSTNIHSSSELSAARELRTPLYRRRSETLRLECLCNSMMETYAFGFRLWANVPEGKKRFSISQHLAGFDRRTGSLHETQP